MMTKHTRWIDVHHHFIPPFYLPTLSSLGVSSALGVAFPKWTPEASLRVMDANDIDRAVVSLSSPGVFFGDQSHANELARRCNEYAAHLVASHPDRFGAFAVLPLPDAEAAINELDYALGDLELDGVILLTNVGGRYLGDPVFDPVYRELNARGAVVFVHPTDPLGEGTPNFGLPNAIIEVTFDTTRAVLNMVRHRIADRYPGIRFMLAHAGGTAPYLAWRMGVADYFESGLAGQFYKAVRDFYVTGRGPHRAIDTLQRLYYDTASAAAPYPLRALQELVDSTRILFGTDFPFASRVVVPDEMRSLSHYEGFNEDQLEAVASRNARALFDRVAEPRAGVSAAWSGHAAHASREARHARR